MVFHISYLTTLFPYVVFLISYLTKLFHPSIIAGEGQERAPSHQELVPMRSQLQNIDPAEKIQLWKANTYPSKCHVFFKFLEPELILLLDFLCLLYKESFYKDFRSF